MKSRMLIALIFTVVSLSASAQPGNEGRIKAWKVAVITDKLSMTPEESAAFWPIYNEREDKVQELKKAQNASKRGLLDKSEEEIEAVLLQQMQMQKDIVDINIEYYYKLKEVISIRKLARLPNAEREFQKMVLEKMQQMKKERMQNREGFRGPRG